MITAFYHIGPVNHWREIVSEQLRLLAAAKFPGHTFIHYGGNEYEQGYIQRVADVRRLPVTFLPSHPGREECPCLEAIGHYVSTPDATDHVLYFHTKGITHLNEWHVVMWRWLMNTAMLTHWEESLGTLEEGQWDFVAPKVSNDPFPHSSGNFWIADREYLRRLEPFEDYYRSFMRVYAHRLHGGWSQRHSAEAWVGSGPDVRACQVTPFPMDMWHHNPWAANIEAQEYATRWGS
jgi:hypothetical protein